MPSAIFQNGVAPPFKHSIIVYMLSVILQNDMALLKHDITVISRMTWRRVKTNVIMLSVILLNDMTLFKHGITVVM